MIIKVHSTILDLVGERYRIMPFSDLSQPYQLTLAWYMSINGHAWGFPSLDRLCQRKYSPQQFSAKFQELLPFFTSRYGNRKFGVGLVNTDSIICSIMDNNITIKETFNDWESYHQWYLSSHDIPVYPEENRWPCIISETEGEVIQDGWHRFHSYVRSGHPKIPVVFFCS